MDCLSNNAFLAFCFYYTPRFSSYFVSSSHHTYLVSITRVNNANTAPDLSSFYDTTASSSSALPNSSSDSELSDAKINYGQTIEGLNEFFSAEMSSTASSDSAVSANSEEYYHAMARREEKKRERRSRRGRRAKKMQTVQKPETFDTLLCYDNLKYMGIRTGTGGEGRVWMLKSSTACYDTTFLHKDMRRILPKDPHRTHNDISYTLRSIVRALVLNHENKPYGTVPDIFQRREDYMAPKCIAIPLLCDSTDDQEKAKQRDDEEPHEPYESTMDLLLLFQEDLKILKRKFKLYGTKDPKISEDDEHDLRGAYPDDNMIREWYGLGSELLEELVLTAEEEQLGVSEGPIALWEREQRRWQESE